MRKYIIAAAIAAALTSPARADDVGAVFGAISGLVLAGPPGAVIGALVGAVYGDPYWGITPANACYIDTSFHRHCPDAPVVHK